MTSIAKKPFIFAIFQGGSGLLSPSLDPCMSYARFLNLSLSPYLHTYGSLSSGSYQLLLKVCVYANTGAWSYDF